MDPGTLTDTCLSGIKIPEALALEAALGRVTIKTTNFLKYGCCQNYDLIPELKIVHPRNQPEIRLFIIALGHTEQNLLSIKSAIQMALIPCPS